MRLLGVLGGMSWASTQHYYRLLNQGVSQRLGGLHSARIVLHSVDFDEVARAQHADDWTTAARILADAARGLASAGAEALLIATNTMHKVAPEIEEASGLPVLHIADATATAVLAAGHRRVGLLATAFTMEEDFYVARLRARGLEVVIPEAHDRAVVHRVIYDELCHDITTPRSKAAFVEVAHRLTLAGSEAVILGCTEIGLLLQPDDVAVPLFDTTQIHAAAGVDFLVGQTAIGEADTGGLAE